MKSTIRVLGHYGVLTLDRHCPTSPSKVYFTLDYIGETGAWKLLGVHVNVAE